MNKVREIKVCEGSFKKVVIYKLGFIFQVDKIGKRISQKI